MAQQTLAWQGRLEQHFRMQVQHTTVCLAQKAWLPIPLMLGVAGSAVTEGWLHSTNA